MAVLISEGGKLVSTSQQIEPGPYKKIGIGKPLAVKLVTVYPGESIQEWGNQAEIMISSQIRFGPRQQPAPRLINMMLYGYRFRSAPPIQDYGGHVFGDPMLYYSRSYAGQRLGVTLRGTEMDKVGPKTWEGITNTITSIGMLALFETAAPYLAAAGLAAKMAKTLIRAIVRNDQLSIQWADFHFGDENNKILQAGRYVFWDGRQIPSNTMRSKYALTTAGDDSPGVLVEKSSGQRLRKAPYFIIQIDGKRRSEYNDFEIGAGSAQLLEDFGDKSTGATIFQTIRELASQVNDARQLSDIRVLLGELKGSQNEEEAALIREKIKARSNLFSTENGDLLKKLLAPHI